jgi:hypothetical protein
MAAVQTASVLNSWDTVRFEVLNARICDLGLRIRHSPLEPTVHELQREMDAKGMTFKPDVYLTDSWGCPDRVPVIGIPFYLADRRLMRIEEEQTGEVEDRNAALMYLRHEAGHAVNYAYRLWKMPEWAQVFGRFTKPYHERFDLDPHTRDFVRHLSFSHYRWTYAQKHPDEDFAETFAVWLTPRSGWRRKYRNWPALRKLLYVDGLMRKVSRRPPLVAGGPLLNAVEDMRITLAEHYGRRTESYRAAAQGYVDDKLLAVFRPPPAGRRTLPARDFIRARRSAVLSRMARWTGLDREDARMILSKLEDRAAVLGLTVERGRLEERLLDLTALATALATDFFYMGRFTE